MIKKTGNPLKEYFQYLIGYWGVPGYWSEFKIMNPWMIKNNTIHWGPMSQALEHLEYAKFHEDDKLVKKNLRIFKVTFEEVGRDL